MIDVKFTLPGSETVTLTGQTIDKLIVAGNGDAALLYLYILKTRGQSSSSAAAVALNKSAADIAAAMAVLARLGLVQLDGYANNDNAAETAGSDSASSAGIVQKPHVAEPRKRTVADMKLELESGSVFRALVEEVQRSLGKILSPDELMRLFGMYDELNMEPEVVLQLVTHCIAESRSSSGGRMPSIRYIEKAAYTWEREGIITLDRAEKYLKELSARRSARGEIKKALHIRDRELSETEAKYVDSWVAMGFGADVVAIAYDRMLVKTGKFVWNYIDTIISSWHSKGLRTPQEITEKDKLLDRNIGNLGRKPAAQKFGAADQQEVDRLQRLLNKLKED